PKSPRMFDAHIGLGDSYLLEGNVEEAVKIYNGTKERFPSDKNITVVDSRLNDCLKKTGFPVRNPVILPPPVPQPQAEQAETEGRISVQIGCFKNRRNADRLSGKLTRIGYESYVELPFASGDNLYRVKVGRLKSKEEAENLAAILKKEGYRTKVCDESASRQR
ncbi:MAG: SPOR domain-containing protein, partial [Candidatus Omnitrophica bacterium]|nr:SPOR domain-containing protein [Candidatus Omnitrophota bacterium]